MVEAVRAGNSLRAVAREFRVSLGTVQRWVRRAGRADLDRVEWTDHPSIPHTFHRTPPEVEARVLGLRRELQDASALGEYGAVAIHRAWPIATWGSPPAIRTIGRILERRGALDRRHRVRRPPPPRGWYLPAVARGEADCDCFDIIAGLVLQGGPEDGMTTGRVHTALQARWRAEGLPSYAQFDNDTDWTGFGVTKSAQSIHANLIYSPFPKLDIGAELIWGTREVESGADGDLRRLHTSVKYSF